MKKIFLIIVLLILTVVSAYVIYRTYPSVSPLGAVKLDYNLNEISLKGDQLVKQLNLDTENKTETRTLQSNRELIRYLYDSYSFRDANKLMRNKLPGYYWELEWKKNNDDVVIGTNGNQEKLVSTGDFKLAYDASGNLLEFRQEVDDSLKSDNLSEEDAKYLAVDFLRQYSPVNPETGTKVNRYKTRDNFKEQEVHKTQNAARTEYEFSWKAASDDLNKDIVLSVTVEGEIISNYSLTYDIPGDMSKEENNVFTIATTVPFYIIIYILIIIIGYKRIRAYEVSFRLALIMGLIVGITFSINLYTIIANSLRGWEVLLPLILSTVFLAAGVFITWAVSETVAREAWKQKFISLDLLTKGYAFHSKVGSAGIAGLTGGVLIYLIWTGILFISEQVVHISFITKDFTNLISHFHSASPVLNIIDKSVYPQIFILAIFFLFVYSGLKRRFSSLFILIPVSALLWGLVNFNDVLPVFWGVLTGFIVGVIFMLFFHYYDILATLTALIVFRITDVGTSLFTNGNPYYLNAGYYLLLVFIILFVFLLIGLFTKDKITDYDSITPAFVKNITERQRLQRELEIARDVQMGFLPVKNPQFKGLDIAARCIPALEVGGDYYDFVTLDENRLGIIIGDVSGKGTQAAFYMTLAKGFVKALSKTVSSPAEFLVKFNELFYENVERGTFISMIYAIADTKSRTLTFARAGHNPVIARHSGKKDVELLNPVGLALGLEKGIIFSKTIKEIKVDIQPGDTFVFYTDGYTEAMNKYKLEFTEERLTRTISENIELSAKELLEKTVTDVKSFTGKALQHDDMTMVVVKYLQEEKKSS